MYVIHIKTKYKSLNIRNHVRLSMEFLFTYPARAVVGSVLQTFGYVIISLFD